MQHAPFAQRIALPRRLHLDDVCAEVGQGFRGKGAGDKLSEFEDADALEDLLRHGVSPCNAGDLLRRGNPTW
ncbi:hypothetical protein D3C81_1558880 [compost metagenome]